MGHAGTTAEWLPLLALGPAPGIVATVRWTPPLVSSQVRARLQTRPPTGLPDVVALPT